MSQPRRPANKDVLVTYEVSQEGPPGDLSPLLHLLIKRGLKSLEEGETVPPVPGPEAAGPAESPPLRVFTPEAEEALNRHCNGKGKGARPKRRRSPSPKQRKTP